MKKRNIKWLNGKIIILFLAFCLLFDLQYRLNVPNSLSGIDDSSYYLHSLSIAKDFDLDYSNQINFENVDPNKFYKNPKTLNFIPKHPIGVGVLTAPFTFLGLFLERLNINFGFDGNIVYFFYSLSAIFYFSLTLILFHKTEILITKKNNENYLLMFILLFGSGVGYFSFERFSMSHIYEVFSIILLIYIFTNKLILKEKFTYLSGIACLIPIFIRWTNYFSLIIPFLIYFVLREKKFLDNKMFNYYFSLKFLLGLTSVPIFFLIFNYFFYGAFVYFPSQIYHNSSNVINSLNSMASTRGYSIEFNLDFISSLFVDFFRILFSSEFGLLFFSPLIFLLVLKSFIYLFKSEFKIFFLNLLIMLIPFVNVLIWKSTASSYGYRYLYSLIPIGFFYYLLISINFQKIINIFAIFSFYSLMVFESNDLTTLSSQINTFGQEHAYSANYYLIGVINSFSDINTIKVFGTSLFVVLCAQIIIYSKIINIETIFTSNDLLLSQYQEFLLYTDSFNLKILFFVLVFLLLNVLAIHRSKAFK